MRPEVFGLSVGEFILSGKRGSRAFVHEGMRPRVGTAHAALGAAIYGVHGGWLREMFYPRRSSRVGDVIWNGWLVPKPALYLFPISVRISLCAIDKRSVEAGFKQNAIFLSGIAGVSLIPHVDLSVKVTDDNSLRAEG